MTFRLFYFEKISTFPNILCSILLILDKQKYKQTHPTYYLMANEIERKFLVNGDYKSLAIKSERIIQGYLSLVPGRTVRVRIRGEKGFLTIKGIGNESGTTRFEWEKEIAVEDAKSLLKLCEPGIISKTRFLVPVDQHTFEVDEFYDDNEGLTVAEIELKSEGETFEKPNWLGEEVTGEIKYFNAVLMKNPFKNWTEGSEK